MLNTSENNLGTRTNEAAEVAAPAPIAELATVAADGSVGLQLGALDGGAVSAMEDSSILETLLEDDVQVQAAMDAALDEATSPGSLEDILDAVRSHPTEGREVDGADSALVAVLMDSGISYEDIVSSMLSLAPGAAASEEIFPMIMAFIQRRYAGGDSTASLPAELGRRWPTSPMLMQSPSTYQPYQPPSDLSSSAPVAFAAPLRSSGVPPTAAPEQPFPTLAANPFSPPPSGPLPTQVLASEPSNVTVFGNNLPSMAPVAFAAPLRSSGVPPTAAPEQPFPTLAANPFSPPPSGPLPTQVLASEPSNVTVFGNNLPSMAPGAFAAPLRSSGASPPAAFAQPFPPHAANPFSPPPSGLPASQMSPSAPTNAAMLGSNPSAMAFEAFAAPSRSSGALPPAASLQQPSPSGSGRPSPNLPIPQPLLPSSQASLPATSVEQDLNPFKRGAR